MTQAGLAAMGLTAERVGGGCGRLGAHARVRHTRAHANTFPHHFAHFTAVRNCHVACRNGTTIVGLSRLRGGRLQGSRHRASEAFSRERRWRRCLPPPPVSGKHWEAGSEPAAPLSIRWSRVRPRVDRDCQVPLALGCVCRSVRGAAGSEWALPPGDCSIALERELEQRKLSQTARISERLGLRSEHPSRQPEWTYRQVGETPARFGTFGLLRDTVATTRASGRPRLDSQGQALGLPRRPNASTRVGAGP